MNPIFSYLLHFAIISITTILITIIFILHNNKNKSSNAANRNRVPPGKTGWPVIGETLKWAMAGRCGCPETFFTDRMRNHSSELFKTSLIGDEMAVFCGAAGNKFLFSNENKYVNIWWPKSITKLMQFSEEYKKSLNDINFSRGFLSEFMKIESLRKYVSLMDSMAKQQLIDAGWSAFKEVKVFPLSQKYTFSLGCSLFLKINDPKMVDEIHEHFHHVTAGLVSVPFNFPGTAFNRGSKASTVIKQKMVKIIRQRRRELLESHVGAADSDLVSSWLIESEQNEQFAVSDDDLASRIIGLLVASYDTTSSAITSIMGFLADYPQVFQKVFQEQMGIAKSKPPGELLNWEDIQKMKYSWCVACESMRIQSPSQIGFKEAKTDFTYAGFSIPKGMKICWSPHTTHSNPEYFNEPEKFDPSRFEGNGPLPYTFVPFGGGPRMCQGKEYARIEILTFMHNAVTKFKWEKVDPNEKHLYSPFATYKNDLLIRLKLHDS